MKVVITTKADSIELRHRNDAVTDVVEPSSTFTHDDD